MIRLRHDFVVPAVSPAWLADVASALHGAAAGLRVEEGRVLLPRREEFAGLDIWRALELVDGADAERRIWEEAEHDLLDGEFGGPHTPPADGAGADVRLVGGEHCRAGAVYRLTGPAPEGVGTEVSVRAWDPAGTTLLTAGLVDDGPDGGGGTARLELRGGAGGFAGLVFAYEAHGPDGAHDDGTAVEMEVEVDAEAWWFRLRGIPGPPPVRLRSRVQGHGSVLLLSPVTEVDGRWWVTMEVEVDAEAEESQGDDFRDLEDLAELANTIALVWRLVVLEADAVADLRRTADILRGDGATSPPTATRYPGTGPGAASAAL
ncbi:MULTISPECIES: hypothetical protein [Nocardiopsis]|uniref:Uncharacterized protein n=1 Tax=Nocardiopsis sinuspersici TaxID=501010 RepID=A0A1V3C754_9ACTN|nr:MULTISPECIES: hypothetical protein [Nocardiopsis]OOC56523.1 hypothetical protein NOSIN_24070 [Nocardiopsis sinuspersici]